MKQIKNLNQLKPGKLYTIKAFNLRPGERNRVSEPENFVWGQAPTKPRKQRTAPLPILAYSSPEFSAESIVSARLKLNETLLMFLGAVRPFDKLGYWLGFLAPNGETWYIASWVLLDLLPREERWCLCEAKQP